MHLVVTPLADLAFCGSCASPAGMLSKVHLASPGRSVRRVAGWASKLRTHLQVAPTFRNVYLHCPGSWMVAAVTQRRSKCPSSETQCFVLKLHATPAATVTSWLCSDAAGAPAVRPWPVDILASEKAPSHRNTRS